MITIRVYADARGGEPFARWYRALDSTAALKVTKALARIQHGNLGDTSPVGGGVFERRIHSGPGYRIYYARTGRCNLMLLIGGTKRTQRRDISRAKSYWRAYLERQK